MMPGKAAGGGELPIEVVLDWAMKNRPPFKFLPECVMMRGDPPREFLLAEAMGRKLRAASIGFGPTAVEGDDPSASLDS